MLNYIYIYCVVWCFPAVLYLDFLKICRIRFSPCIRICFRIRFIATCYHLFCTIAEFLVSRQFIEHDPCSSSVFRSSEVIFRAFFAPFVITACSYPHGENVKGWSKRGPFIKDSAILRFNRQGNTLECFFLRNYALRFNHV